MCNDSNQINNSEWVSIKKLTLDEYVDYVNKFKKPDRKKRIWRFLIKNNKLTCSVTGKKVSYCSLDRNINTDTLRYNFYSVDNELFNIDHKIPKSKGGSIGKFDNMQVMIVKENDKKGNNLIYY